MTRTRLDPRCAILALVASLGSCTREDCRFAPGEKPGVFVIDTATHEPICDAVVVARDGDLYEETIRATMNCGGIYPLSGRDGTYAVSIAAPGYQEGEETVRVVDLDCGFEVENDGPRDGYPGFAHTVTVPLAPQNL